MVSWAVAFKKPEQAIIALGICWKSQATLEEAFKQLGWSPAIIAAALPPKPSTNLPPAMSQVLAQQQAKQAQVQANQVQVQPNQVQAQANQAQAQANQAQAQAVPVQAPPSQETGPQQLANPGSAAQPKPAPSLSARKPTASATAANLPAMPPPGQELHVAQGGGVKPFDTGEMSPVKDKEGEGEEKPAKKRLADLIP